LDSSGDGDSTTAAGTMPETLPLDCAPFPTGLKLSDLPGLYAKLEHPATITKVDEYEGYWFVFFRLNEWDGVLSEYTQSIDRINPETGDRITDINAYGLPENYLIEKYKITGPDSIRLLCHGFGIQGSYEMCFPFYCEIYFGNGTADVNKLDYCASLEDDGYLTGGTLQNAEFEDFDCDFTSFYALFDIIDGQVLPGDMISTLPETQLVYDDGTNSVKLVIGKVSFDNFREGDLGLSNIYISSASLKKYGDGAVITLKLTDWAAYYHIDAGFVRTKDFGKTDSYIEYLEVKFYSDLDPEYGFLTSDWYEPGEPYFEDGVQKFRTPLEGSFYDVKAHITFRS
jgi:hypothetical protein